MRVEDREVIAVSRSYPTKIGQNWTCIYNFFTPDKTQRIVVEFKDFLFEGCSIQNLTITDLGTGRSDGPYCNDKMPEKFISDTSKIRVETYTGDLDHDANSKGYMFGFWRIDEDEALEMKKQMTRSEFAQADYQDYGMYGRGMGMGRGMGQGWGMGRGVGMGAGVGMRPPGMGTGAGMNPASGFGMGGRGMNQGGGIMQPGMRGPQGQGYSQYPNYQNYDGLSSYNCSKCFTNKTNSHMELMRILSSKYGDP